MKCFAQEVSLCYISVKSMSLGLIFCYITYSITLVYVFKGELLFSCTEVYHLIPSKQHIFVRESLDISHSLCEFLLLSSPKNCSLREKCTAQWASTTFHLFLILSFFHSVSLFSGCHDDPWMVSPLKSRLQNWASLWLTAAFLAGI